MGVVWSWAMGPETHAEMLAMGWTLPTSCTSSNDSADIYSYSGSPARWSRYNTADARTPYDFPSDAVVGMGDSGWVTVAWKNRLGSTVPGGVGFGPIWSAPTANLGFYTAFYNPGSGNSLHCYVGGVFKGSTAAYDWSNFHYLSFRYDHSSALYQGEFYIDGNLEVTGSQTRTAYSGNPPAIRWNYATQFTGNAAVAQFVFFDGSTPASEAANPYFVTRISPNDDVTGAGTWDPVASPGSAAQAPLLVSPYDSTTIVSASSPTTGDKFIVATDSGSLTTLDTLLGTTTVTPAGAPSIAGITCHTFSSGSGVVSVKAGVKDANASSTVYGSASLVDGSSLNYISATSAFIPGTVLAWSGSVPSPDLVYEVN